MFSTMIVAAGKGDLASLAKLFSVREAPCTPIAAFRYESGTKG